MKRKIASAVFLSTFACAASASTVTDFTGSWGSTTTAGGTVEIVSVEGVGGNLENNAPNNNGVVRLATANNTASRSEAGTGANFGKVADIFNANLSFSYSWYDDGSTAVAAPSLKLAFYDASYAGDGYGQLIYEPYWQSATGNTSVTPTQGDWVTSKIDLNNGRFWNSGMFGISSSGGGAPNRTLSEWLTAFNAAEPNGFSNASLVGISVGLGSNNPAELGYVDSVSWSGTASDGSADFSAAAEAPAPVPLPAGLPMLLVGLGAFGAVVKRRQR